MQVLTGSVHHITLRVWNVSRSTAFYAELLGFKQSLRLGSRVLLSNGSAMLVLTPLADSMGEVSANLLDENRVGIERLGFRVGSYRELEQAVCLLDEHGVSHGEVTDWGPDLGLYVLAFRDPDNIPLALTASYG
jgi:catechol 2,3-dioxygenase-like lactoylglutathione lyase family enzyme